MKDVECIRYSIPINNIGCTLTFDCVHQIMFDFEYNKQLSKQLIISYRLDALDLGVYKVCFDNTFSHFARKLVFFEIITGDEDEDEDDDKKDWKAAQEELASIVDMTLEDFKVLREKKKWI